MGDTSFATKYELNQLDKRLSGETKTNRENIAKHDAEIARLTVLYESLKDLPKTMHNLDKTITTIGENLRSIQSNMIGLRQDVNEQNIAISKLKESDSEQDDRIDKVDGKGKIDLVDSLTKNFWKILALFGTVYYVLNDLVNRG